MLVPVVLGVLAGRIRWGQDLPTPTGTATSGAGLAGVVAALVGGLVLLVSGSLGGGRLDAVGPRLLPVVAASAGLVLLGFLAEAAFQSVRLSWELHQAERRAEERRLRRAARGLAEPGEAEAPGGDPAVDIDGEVEADDRVGDGGPADIPGSQSGPPQSGSSPSGPPQSAPRRQPRPVRESVVIPIVVPSGDQDLPGGAAQEAAVPGAGADESDVTVDLTVDDPEPDLGDPEPDPVGESPLDGDRPAVDGDSTVDLTVDPADLAEIRTAWRQGSTGEGPA
jgi:hypothetical protein